MLLSLSLLQVSFPAPHAVPHELLAVHAVLRLHLQHHGQVIRPAVSELAQGDRGNAGPCSSHAHDRLAVGLPFTDRIRLHRVQTI